MMKKTLKKLPMKLPTIIVNFKNYESSTGQQALLLAKIHEKVAKEENVSIAIAVNAIDLAEICKSVDIPVFAQHMDAVSYGGCTGKILPELVKEVGAYGTLLNHAECPIEDVAIEKSIARARELGLFTVVCANDVARAESIMKFNPDLVAIEPPELIGGDVSVSTANPSIIENSAKRLGENRVLVGAGIKNFEDVKIALSLGACGVLLASGITKAKDPEAALRELARALK